MFTTPYSVQKLHDKYNITLGTGDFFKTLTNDRARASYRWFEYFLLQAVYLWLQQRRL